MRPKRIGQYESKTAGTCFIMESRYADDLGNMAIFILTEKAEVLLKLTVNTTNSFDSDIFIAKTYSENAPYREEILATGYFKDLGARIRLSEWAEGELWQLIKRD